MGFLATCTHCGWPNYVGMELQQVTFVNCGTNVGVGCVKCRRTFEAARGGDGTFSTSGGRLRRVARTVADSSTQELESLRDQLQAASDQRSVELVAEVLRQLGLTPPVGPADAASMSRREQRLWNLATMILAVILAVLAMRLSGQQVAPSDVENLCDRAERDAVDMDQPNESPLPSRIDVGRNQLCPCASGRKYKRCHGQHPSAFPRPSQNAS